MNQDPNKAALDAQFALALNAFIEGLSTERPDRQEYDVDEDREEYYESMFKAA